jgi:hypothetical protein
MTRFQIIGWKTYGVATLAILFGLHAASRGNWSDGLKGIIGGCAVIALRDVLGKILSALDENRKAMNNMRASIEALMDNKTGQHK